MRSLMQRILIFLLVIVISVALLTTTGFIIFLNHFSETATEFGKTHMIKFGERLLIEKAKDTASHISTYLQMNREKTKEELINDKYLHKIATAGFGIGGYVAVTDNNGVAIFHPNPNVIGKSLKIFAREHPEMWNIVKRGIRNRSSYGYYTFIKNNKAKIKKFMAIKKIENKNWYVLATKGLENFLEPVKQFSKTIISNKRKAGLIYAVSVLLISVIIFIILYFFSKNISNQINTLASLASEINMNKLDFNPPEYKLKELENLSQTINKMIQKVKQNIDEKTELADSTAKAWMMLDNIINSTVKYGLIVTNEKGEVELFSNGAEIMFQYSKPEIENKKITILNKPEDLNHQGFDFYLEHASEDGFFDMDLTGVRKDGSTFPMNINASIRFNIMLELEGFVIIVYDKTEEKNAEELKKQHEIQTEQLRNIELILNSLPIGIIVTNVKGESVVENSRARRILNFKPGVSSVGTNLIENETLRQSGISKVISETMKQQKQRELKNVVYKTKNKNEKSVLDLKFTPLVDFKGNIQGTIIALVDQTLLANSIQKMQELNTIIEKSPVIAYKMTSSNGDTAFEYISENISQFGYKPEDFYNKRIKTGDFIHPDDAQEINEKLQISLEGTLQYRIQTKLGNIRWVESTVWQQKNENNVNSLQGIILDITERKNAEEEFVKAQKMIEKQISILKKYVDQSVLDFMMNEEDIETSMLKSEVIDGTVCFIDVCGFTAISENNPPDLVVQMLNEYFDVIVQELISRNGHVDKFMGDAIMAVFKGDFQIERAVEGCIAIRNRINDMMDTRVAGKTFSPNVSIGLNKGNMISGNIGSETIERLDFTVIGDVVNTAARFQGAAKDGQIIISDTINEVIEDIIQTEPLGKVKLKNKEKPITIYNVLNFK